MFSVKILIFFWRDSYIIINFWGNYIDLRRGLAKQHKHPLYFVKKHPPPLKLTTLKDS